MKQFLKLSTHDPEGFMIVDVKEISAVASTPEEGRCRLITDHGEYLVDGSIEFFIEEFNGLFGGHWTAIPEPEPTNG